MALSAAAIAAPALHAAAHAAVGPDHYSVADYARVERCDAHVHANTSDPGFLEQARDDGFELLSINVDYPDFPSLSLQHAVVVALAAKDPTRFHWATTFSMKGFGKQGWADNANAGLARDVANGVLAVKIWKNVGLEEKNANGKFIRLDDPGLAPVAEEIRTLGVPLIDHQGEPQNCWLPLDKMTTDNDREYFRNHPEYYMDLHPENPGYEDLMAAHNRFVAAHPKLRFVGAHLASLEYDVDRIAGFLDRFPQASVDMAARMSQLQYQSVRGRKKVRNFFIRYQDRLLYGTDLTFDPDTDPATFRREARSVWIADWQYLATGETRRVDMIDADVPGLALPRAVIDKIYYANAKHVFAVSPPAN
ncbi:MAG: amidohydrolase family protein [Rhodanobacter sp.]